MANAFNVLWRKNGRSATNDDEHALKPLVLGSDDEDECEVNFVAGPKTYDGSDQTDGQVHSDGDSETIQTFTVDSAIEEMGFGWFQWKLSMMCGLVSMADAMEMMILSIISPALHCAWGISSWKQALITTMVFIGMMFGASLFGVFSDTFGRKKIYFPLGTVFEVSLAYLVMPTLGWRWLLGLSSLPILIFCLLAIKNLPESARFNVYKGKLREAVKTLKQVSKDNKKDFTKGQLQIPPTQSKSLSSWGRLFQTLGPKYRRTTLLLWGIWFANAFCYYGLVLFSSTVFELEQGGDCTNLKNGLVPEKVEPLCFLDCYGLTPKDYKDLLSTTLAEFPGLIVNLILLDTIGRKATMGVLFFVFAIFMFLQNFCFGRFAQVAFMFVARACISSTFTGAYIYTAEVYPVHFRTMGIGLCSSNARIGALITPFIAQVLIKSSLTATVWVYVGVAVAASIMCICLPIETKGRSLDDG